MAGRQNLLARAAQLWLLGLLAIVPFQLMLANELGRAGRVVGYADELSLVGLSGLVLYLRLRGQARKLVGERLLLALLAVFIAVAAASALHNQTGVLPFALGGFDYVKGLGFVWIGASLADERLAERLFRIVSWVAIFLAAWALVEFVIDTIHADGRFGPGFRYGLARPRSLAGHANLLGLYTLLALILELTVGRRRDRVVALFSLTSILSLSRLVHGAMLLVLAPLVWRKKWLIAPLIVALGLTIAGSSLTRDEYGGDTADDGTATDEPGEVAELAAHNSFRAATMAVGQRIFADHPILGVGAGRFGGWVSIKTDSPVYRRYDLPERHISFFHHIRSLDQFFPQLLAELGAVGSAAFGGLGLALFALLVGRFRRANPGPAREWAAAGALALVVVPIYCLGAGLNIAIYLTTAMTVCGVALAVPALQGGPSSSPTL